MAERRPPTAAEYEGYKERFNNWGRWGSDDQLGTLNFITDGVRRASAGLVIAGRSVSLSRPLPTPAVLSSPRNRQPADHRISVDRGGSSDYIGLSYHGFVATHVDALCHIFTEDGLMYGGRPASLVSEVGAAANAIDGWRDGIVTRAVLYDVPRFRGVPYASFDSPVHGWELADIAAAQDVRPLPGDAVIVRAGAAAFWDSHPDFTPAWCAPGLHASVLEFLYKHDAAILGWDLMEAPGQEDYRAHALPIHSIAIPYMGLPLLDNCDLDDLARMCIELGRWEFQLVVAPLVVQGGTGSPVNPIALF